MLRTLTTASLVLTLAILLGGSTSSRASFPGQNGDILFTSTRDGDTAIFRMNADASNQVKLADSTGVDFGPAWSPNGNRIAFTSERDGNREIYVMNADGSEQLRLTNSSSSDFEPTWSADGQTIAFRASNGIATVPATGGATEPLIDTGGTLSGPAYSPDGTQIVYKNDQGGPFNLYIADADGTNIEILTDDIFDEDDPNWSPDSSKIAFVRALTASPGAAGLGGQTDIFVINRDGTGLVNLTNDVAHDSEPVWSPDGASIIFYSERTEGEGLFIMDADGTDITLLLSEAYSPNWQPVPEGAQIWGDADCSGAIDPVDSLKTLRANAGLTSSTEPECPALGTAIQVDGADQTWGDLDCSGAVDAVDSLKVLRHDAGLSVTKPEDCPNLDNYYVVVVT